MSDIFTNLVLRNGGMSSPAILQPRLPSLFESSSSVDGLPETISAQAQTGSFSASTETPYHQINLSPTEHASISPNVKSVQETSAISTPLGQPPVEHLKEGQSLNPVRASMDPLSALKQQENAPSNLFHSSTGNTLDDNTLLDMDRRRVETVMSREEQTVGRKYPKDDQQPSTKSLERVVHPRVESLTQLQKDARQSEHQKLVVKSSLERPSNVILPRENAMGIEPPVVQIHIGRIEVRAIMPQPAQPVAKAAPVQPRMTLDDYLRQREGSR
jgi:hypothetical protein